MKRNLLETFKPEFESKAGLTPTFLVSQVVVRRPPDVDVTWAKGRNHCASRRFRDLKKINDFHIFTTRLSFLQPLNPRFPPPHIDHFLTLMVFMGHTLNSYALCTLTS